MARRQQAIGSSQPGEQISAKIWLSFSEFRPILKIEHGVSPFHVVDGWSAGRLMHRYGRGTNHVSRHNRARPSSTRNTAEALGQQQNKAALAAMQALVDK